MRRALRAIPVLALPVLLAGCFSTDNHNVTNPVSFTGFSSMQAGSSVKIGGIGQEVRAGNGVSAARNMTVDLKTGADGTVSEVKVSGPETITSWHSYLYEPGGPEMVLAAHSDDGKNSVYMLPPDAGFEYQTFGTWQTGKGSVNGTAGAFSVGSQTAGIKVPEDDKAAFTGYSLGTYVDADGKQFVTSGQANLTADFAARTVEFETSHTHAMAAGGGGSSPASGLDLSGTMTYAAGSGALSGSVASANGMTGRLDGRFFGPEAEEVGGVFSLGGGAGETFVGSFGAAAQE